MKFFLTLIAAAATTFSAPILSAQAPVAASSLLPGDPMPNLEAVTLDGKPFDLAEDFKGQVVLIDYWATWCGPCLAETPNIIKSYEKWKKQGLKVVTISLDEDPEKARAYLKKKKVDWTNIADGLGFKSPLAIQLKISGIPQIMLIGRDGNVYASSLRGERLSQLIDQAMTGTGIALASSQSNATSALPAHTVALIAELEKQLSQGTEAQSLAALKPVLALKTRPYKELERLCVKYNWTPTGKFHPQTIYLLADAYYNTGIITSRDIRTVGAARAHAAYELGGPYMLEQAIKTITSLNRSDASPAITQLLLHVAMDGDSMPALRNVYNKINTGTLTYARVNDILSHIEDKGSQERAILNQWLEHQKNQPANRVTITPVGDKYEIRYNASQTVLQGSLKISAMVKQSNGSSHLRPMRFSKEKGWHLTLDAPAADSKTRIHFIDNSARTDDNAGNYWWIKQPAK